MADSNLARSILELYPEITIDDSRSNDEVVTFSLMEKTFALLCPEEQTPTSVAVILVIDDDFDYPHIMLSEIDFKGDDVLAKGKYRFVCLHQSGSVVSFLQSFDENNLKFSSFSGNLTTVYKATSSKRQSQLSLSS